MKKTIFSLLIAAMCMMTCLSAFAQEHPAYLHGLADLRAARWMIDHRPATGEVQSKGEITAINEIDAAINEIRQASIDDHKDLRDHVGADEIAERTGRLQKAIDLLKRTRFDIEKREDNVWAQGLRTRVLHHIDEAIKFSYRAIEGK